MKLEKILKNTKLKIATVGLASVLFLGSTISCFSPARYAYKKITQNEDKERETIREKEILICTSEPNAEVYIDGQLIGYTPGINMYFEKRHPEFGEIYCSKFAISQGKHNLIVKGENTQKSNMIDTDSIVGSEPICYITIPSCTDPIWGYSFIVY